MQQLTTSDLSFVVRRLPKDVRSLMVDRGLFVGGGVVREIIAGNCPNDIDMFGGDAILLGLAADLTAKVRGGKVHKTDNAMTVLAPPRVPVQFITRWLFTDPEKLVESFDFTVCQAVVWADPATKRFHSVCADAFYSDLAARRLVYTFPKRDEEAGGSMMRVVKFLKRGYSIQTTSLAGVIARVANQVRWGQVGDNETAAAKVIAGLLQEVDPLLVIDGLEPVNDHEPIEPATNQTA